MSTGRYITTHAFTSLPATGQTGGCSQYALPVGEYYPLQDLLYRTTALTDASGDIQEAYGNTLAFKAPGSGSDWWANDALTTHHSACEIILCGYRYDWEMGLYQVRYREFHPTLGRWAQRDSAMRYKDSMSLYQYVRANPVNLLDWSGQASTTWELGETNVIFKSAKADIDIWVIAGVNVLELANLMRELLLKKERLDPSYHPNATVAVEMAASIPNFPLSGIKHSIPDRSEGTRGRCESWRLRCDRMQLEFSVIQNRGALQVGLLHILDGIGDRIGLKTVKGGVLIQVSKFSAAGSATTGGITITGWDWNEKSPRSAFELDIGPKVIEDILSQNVTIRTLGVVSLTVKLKMIPTGCHFTGHPDLLNSLLKGGS